MVKGIRMLVLAVSLGAIIVPTAAMADSGASPASVRNQMETSLMVSGHVDIETDGSVSHIDLDHEEKLPPGVAKFVRDSGLRWQFEPIEVGGQVVKARAPMNLRVVAKKLDNGNFQIDLRGVSFERYDSEDPQSIAMVKMDAPRYPTEAFRAGASGTVYLIVKVGRDGHVEDAVAEQVNLRIFTSEGEMRRLRKIFANASLDAGRKWTFRTPTAGEQATRPYWTVRVPVSYAISVGRLPTDEYGAWVSYIPGPRETAPWADKEKEGASFSPDTLGDGGVYLANSNAPRLLTPLQGG